MEAFLGDDEDKKRRDGSSSDHSAAAGAAETSVDERIGQELRKHYDDVANEPLPDRFRELLDRLRRGETHGDN